MLNCYSKADQSRNGGWLSLVSKKFFSFGKVLLAQIRDSVGQKQWSQNGNESIKLAAAKVCGNVDIKRAFLDACSGSPTAALPLVSLMCQLVLKTFHARAGASMKAWKIKNTGRRVKGSSDSSFHPDLKSKVSRTTKNMGAFKIKRRRANDDSSRTAKRPRK